MEEEVATAIGTPNIALVKYWGRRDSALNLPTNSSISMTMDETLCTKTSVAFSKNLPEDIFYLNGEIQDFRHGTEKTMKVKRALDEMRKFAGIRAKAMIVSKNFFPTGGGIASSASGGATLTFALSKALGLNLKAKELSIVARQVSGSASRSVLGGIVKWNRGKKRDGSDSYAEQVFDKSYWPDLIDIVCMISGEKKKVSSSEGHDLAPTSILYKARIPYAEKAVERAITAIRQRDLNALAEIVMRDSNNMHATMLDSWPPIIYMTDLGKEIMAKIHELNAAEGEMVAGYTHDAGPNTQIITIKSNRNKVMSALKEVKGIKDIITVNQGDGPRLLSARDSLITPDLVPKG